MLLPLAVLDFLCVHPFTDGNGRVARLLSLLLLYHFDYHVGRYVSLERIVEESRTARRLGAFGIADIERDAPGVSRDMVRHVLRQIHGRGALGRCRGAFGHLGYSEEADSCPAWLISRTMACTASMRSVTKERPTVKL